jgi:hypothetical protein
MIAHYALQELQYTHWLIVNSHVLLNNYRLSFNPQFWILDIFSQHGNMKN